MNARRYRGGVEQGRTTFSEQGPDETFGSRLRAGVTNKIPKVTIYIYTQYIIQEFY